MRHLNVWSYRLSIVNLEKSLNLSPCKIIIFTACFGLWVSSAVNAKKPSWYKYENSHFIAYSNASEKRTESLLLELEKFRAAVLQVANVDIPSSAPKTRVLILKSKNELRKLTITKGTAGFAVSLQDHTLIVAPASGRDRAMVIRHEYAHALLAYKEFKYPSWYNEGFAELLAETVIDEKNNSFSIGEVTDRAIKGGKFIFDWNLLISERFNSHQIKDPYLASSAYSQAWLLVHYATLGDNLRNLEKLQAYFDLLKDGELSGPAFVKAFGASPKWLWENDLEEYANRIPYYTFQFDDEDLDINFERSAADPQEYEYVVEYFRLRSIAYWRGKQPRRPLKELSGSWDVVTFGEQCLDPGRITVDEPTESLIVRRYDKFKSGEWGPKSLSYKVLDKITLLVTSNEPGIDQLTEENESWHLHMRGKDIFCLHPAEMENVQCGLIVTKCSD